MMDGKLFYERIKRLCNKKGISVAELERILEFGNGSIKKWSKTITPAVDKVVKVATYFEVSIDYLTGMTDVESSISDIINDEDIISVQRARERMTQQDKDKMMQMLRIGFDYAFSDDTNGDK